MRVLSFLIELFLILALSFFITEAKYHFLEKIAKKELQKNGIEIKNIEIKRLDLFELKSIKYKNKIVSKKIEINLNYLTLLYGYLGFDSIKIDKININSLLNIKTKTSSSSGSGFFIPIKIYKLDANGVFIYKNDDIKILAAASNLTLSKNIFGKINKLFIVSKYGDIKAAGDIENLKLRLTGEATPNKAYLSKLNKKIDFKNLKDIKFMATFDKDKARFKIDTSTKNIIKDFKPTIIKTTLKGEYIYDKSYLASNLLAYIAFKNIKTKLNSRIFYKKSLKYDGNATVSNILLPYKKSEALKNLKVSFKGDIDKIKINIFNNFIKAKATIKKAKNNIKFALKSDRIYIKNILKEKRLENIYLYADLNGSYRKSLEISYNIISNLIDIKGELKDKNTKAYILLSNSSILQKRGIHLEKLFPIKISSNINTPLKAKFSNPILKGTLKYEKNRFYSKIDIKDSNIVLKSKKFDKLNISFESKSLKNLIYEIDKIYPLKTKNLDGSLSLKALLDLKNLKYSAKITSQEISYEYAKDKFYKIKYFTTDLIGDTKTLFIKYYALAFKNHAIYSTKTSVIRLDDSKIKLKNFWIEDKIKIDGFYAFNADGVFHIEAKNYNYSSIEGIANVDVNLTANIKKEKIFLEGNLFINSATIEYNPKKIRNLEDEDIIVVDKPKPRSNFFLNSIALNIHISSKKPFLYKISGLKANLTTDLTLWKEFQKDLNLLGELVILKGVYNFNQKIFYISKSALYFFGKPTNPYLNIDANYKKEPYTINVKVVGELENPIISFSSEPYLSQNDILSMILFDSKTSSLLTNSSTKENFAGMFSNFFVKDLVNSFGLKLDRLSLITSGDRIGFEIGKKISDKITIIYKNDQISSVILRYKINNHLKSEVLISPENNALNLFYDIVK